MMEKSSNGEDGELSPFFLFLQKFFDYDSNG